MKYKAVCVVLYGLAICCTLCSCMDKRNNTVVDRGIEGPMAKEKAVHEICVERLDTNGLIVLFPKFSSIDLVCGEIPSKSDSSVILVAEAAYTGECLQEFNHSNILGDHVSGGVRYKGTRCRRNTGAFVYYNHRWNFLSGTYSHELDSAAKNGGAGFGQELFILNGKSKATVRKDTNRNQFRALCEKDGRLCVIESDSMISFGSFKERLLGIGVSNAIYLDMGAGWNHAWYRGGEGEVQELHPKLHDYCTNWITFYRD